MFVLPNVVTKAVPWDESKHPRDAGKFSSSPGASGKKPQQHNERLAELTAQIEAAKKARREAHAEHVGHAKDTLAKVDEYVSAAKSEVDNMLAFEPSGDFPEFAEFNEKWTEMEEVAADLTDSEWTVAERFEKLGELRSLAKQALKLHGKVEPFTDDDDLTVTEEELKENGTRLESLISATEAARQSIREHAEHRRAIQSIREMKSLRFELPGFVTKARGGGFGGLAARIITSAIRGHFDESKHRRGQPGNRGQFASGGGGSQSKPTGRTSATPPPLPRTPKAKPQAQSMAGRRYNPKFGTKIPHPPSLPGKKQPSLPGSGHPPENIGNPKDESEAREHFIWLMGRAGILRRQGQSGTPLTPKQTKELTLSINLANRIHAQHFSEEAQARKAEEAKTGKAADPFGLPTVAERSKPSAAKPKTEVKTEPKAEAKQTAEKQPQAKQPELVGAGKGVQSVVGGLGKGVSDSLWEHIENTIKTTGDVPSGERGVGGKKPTYIGQAWDRLKESGLHTHPEAPQRFVAAMRQAHQYAGAYQGKPGANYHKLMGEGIIAGLNQHFGDLISQAGKSKPQESRPNAALDEIMAAPPEESNKKPRTGKTELRPNPLLDELFGKAFTLPAIVKIS